MYFLCREKKVDVFLKNCVTYNSFKYILYILLVHILSWILLRKYLQKSLKLNLSAKLVENIYILK